MTIKNGKIAEATESELFDYYLSRGFDDIMSFKSYMERCKSLGTVIIEKEAGDEQASGRNKTEDEE